MRFKNIYIEITNICNMSCPFCLKDSRKGQIMSIKDYNTIINKIKNYTEGIYLHVKGEPLMHPDLEKILHIAHDNNLKVNITTNGTLLKEKLPILLKHNFIRQINISLHSNLNNDSYLNDVFIVTEELLKKTDIYINYRLWNIHTKSNIIDKINDYYKVDILKTNKIRNKLFIEMEHKFDWPTLDNKYYNEKGKCYGLINQIAILVNGDVVPCCLDSQAIIKLGNIFEEDLDSIINSDKSKIIINGFKNNNKIEELCKHCNFLENRK